MYKKERPVILSIVAILEMLTGVLVLLMGGFFVIISFGLLGEDFSSAWESTFAAAFGAVFIVLAGAILFVGFLIFILGYGLWKLNLAAWFVSTILYGLSSISIVLSYETYLLQIQAGNFSNLLTPMITIGLFIYFLTIKDRFS
ncbi:MAG: hypothetical protein KAT16_10125 [Candidatus Heimdallarchaeota archaeon]|nr:hypothetical protein [Candidatus Heimdallarchaeota archaeon]